MLPFLPHFRYQLSTRLPVKISSNPFTVRRYRRHRRRSVQLSDCVSVDIVYSFQPSLRRDATLPELMGRRIARMALASRLAGAPPYSIKTNR